MRDLAIYCLLNGVFTTARLHNIEELTVRMWLRDLDYDNCSFFQAVREFVVKTALRVGPDKVAELLGLPIWTVKTLVGEFGGEANVEPTGRVVSNTELRRRARLLHAQGFDEEFIASTTQLPRSQITQWLIEPKTLTKTEVKPKEDDDLFDQMREEAAFHSEPE